MAKGGRLMTFLGVPNPPLPGANRKRPNNGIPFTHTAKNELRTQCKLCPEGVFTGDDTVWIRGRLIGLAHRSCAVRAGVTVIELPRTEAPAAAPVVAPVEKRVYGAFPTATQIATVQALANGMTVAEIAKAQGTTAGTINNTLHRARLRIGAEDNAALVKAAREQRLINSPEPKG